MPPQEPSFSLMLDDPLDGPCGRRAAASGARGRALYQRKTRSASRKIPAAPSKPPNPAVSARPSFPFRHEFGNGGGVGDGTYRLPREHDAQGEHGAPGPTGKVVQVHGNPRREQHHLGGKRGHILPVPLSEEARAIFW